MVKKDESKAIGGKARAESLSAEDRSEIAKKAAKARWSNKTQKVSHKGILDLHGFKILCYVLNDGTRVLSSREMQRAMNLVDDNTDYQVAGTRLKRYLTQKSLKPFIYKDKSEDHYEPLICFDGDTKINAYEATRLVDLCDAFMDARNKIDLSPRQAIIAKQCEILVRSFAKLGIIALVDEATGYQEIRDRQALQTILDKYLNDEWAKWTKTFPDNYYRELFRLKGLSYPTMEGGRKPGVVGHWTNDIVYSRIAPGILKELRDKNPNTENRGRKRKHHQFLTREIGHPALTEHISNVTFLMSGCSDWADFKKRLDQAKPKFGDTIEMDI